MLHCPPISRQKHEKTLALVCAGSFTNFPHEGFKWGLFRGMVAQSKILQNARKQMKNNDCSMPLDTKHHFSNIGTENSPGQRPNGVLDPKFDPLVLLFLVRGVYPPYPPGSPGGPTTLVSMMVVTPWVDPLPPLGPPGPPRAPPGGSPGLPFGPPGSPRCPQ